MLAEVLTLYPQMSMGIKMTVSTGTWLFGAENSIASVFALLKSG